MSTTKLVHLTTPLGPDKLMPYRMTATEELGRMFRYDLELLSEDPNIALDDLLGKVMTVSVDLPGGKARWFNGYVTRFAYVGRQGRWVRYEATLRPWLWFLTRVQDCRIFGNGADGSGGTVLDIAKKVFRKNGFSDFEEKIQGSYLPRTYCVQYRESDFDFVSRLFEEEGLYYFFKHEDGKHTLEIADAPGSHEALEAYDELPFHMATEGGLAREDHVFEWRLAMKVESGEFEHRDFEFVTPSVDLTARAAASRSFPYGKLQVYDPPGYYVESHDVSGGDGSDKDAQDRGRAYAQVRLDEMQAGVERLRGMSNAVGLVPGGTFALTLHHRDDQNRKYLVVSTRHELTVSGYEGIDTGRAESVYRVGFTAVPATVPYRAEPLTPRPLISGPQTAIVTGKSGEEIWTDKHGRVKVQFHWDRVGKQDENSSCWVRVAQVWSGQNWGGVHIPRMGQEVIVEFLDGDPDRPIITGRVYNGRQTPPYALPDNATQSGIKSRSSKGGGPANFNELRFEDKKGSEQVYLHAEKDQANVVEHDMSTDVGHDQTLTVGHDQTNTIKNNMTTDVGVDQKLTVGSNQTEEVGANQSISVGANRTEAIDGNRSLKVGGNKDEKVEGSKSIEVGGDLKRDIGGKEEIAIGGNREITIAGEHSEKVVGEKSVMVIKSLEEKVLIESSHMVGGSHELKAGKNFDFKAGSNVEGKAGENVSLSAGKNYEMSAAEEAAETAGKKFSISGGEEVIIGSGDAQIVLKKDGTVEIKGKDITLTGSGKINVKADSDVTMKGSKILQN
ncbi:MAG TPA: type VI secretion system tip protein TssI/VgrG [Candidatus Bathyarchaeia archaeon]|nr:type VI secretion system tip protein TssI/VgrG [Candidatus Bathyarchaeia archaeon]